MPELPEVEVARRAVEEHCVGKTIKKAVIANDSKVIDEVSPSDFEAALLGKTVISAHRKGRNLWLQLDSPPFPSFQFGTVLFRNPKKNHREELCFSFLGRVWFVLY
jgi:formamidopyrimidine-DNA glycosylase